GAGVSGTTVPGTTYMHSASNHDPVALGLWHACIGEVGFRVVAALRDVGNRGNQMTTHTRSEHQPSLELYDPPSQRSRRASEIRILDGCALRAERKRHQVELVEYVERVGPKL